MSKPRTLTFRLNDEERKLIEDNYGLIYSFAIKKNLELDEVYGELATGMCYAAHSFNPKRGKFSTLAYYCMSSELNKTYKYNNRNRRIPEDKLDHYDKLNIYERESLWDITDFKLSRFNNPYNKAIDEINYNNVIKRISKILTDKEKAVLYYKLKGLTNEEIGKIENVKHQAITHRIKNIRLKIKQHNIL